MPFDRLQKRRFELKYQIDESAALDIRRALRAELVPDENGASQEVPVYPVHSLYFDSEDYALCRATLHGERNRFKLRARYYRDDSDEPVYLEVKRREDRCIRKQRALVWRPVVADLMAGELPRMAHLVEPSGAGLADLEVFCELARRLRARASAHVGYQREAWVSEGRQTVRVTFDRTVRCEPVTQVRFSTAFSDSAQVFVGKVVMEIKFTDRFPAWLTRLVASHSLRVCSAAKYAEGLATSGEVVAGPLELSAGSRVALGDFAGFRELAT